MHISYKEEIIAVQYLLSTNKRRGSRTSVDEREPLQVSWYRSDQPVRKRSTQFNPCRCTSDSYRLAGPSVTTEEEYRLYAQPDSIRITILVLRFNLYHDCWLYCDLWFNNFIVGKDFAENSRSTSLQRVAMRRVVSLSSCYFLQQPFPWNGCWGSCG